MNIPVYENVRNWTMEETPLGGAVIKSGPIVIAHVKHVMAMAKTVKEQKS